MAAKKKAAVKAAPVQTEQMSEPASPAKDRRSVPVWEGGETRSQYLARRHQYALDNNIELS